MKKLNTYRAKEVLALCVFVLLTAFGTTGCAEDAKIGCPSMCDRDWSEGCSSSDAPPVANFWAGPKTTDVTFLAFGDAQFPSGPADMNQLNALALNAADSLLHWDSAHFGVDAPVSHVRGVIMAGDISNDGRDGRYYSEDNILEFTDVYGLCGNAALKFPVFEGYGNHDYFVYDHIMYRLTQAHPVADAVSQRNPYRVGLVNVAPGKDGHYSWDWDNIHFVMVNLKPSDVVPVTDVPGNQDPRHALQFLENDLRTHVASTHKRVVVISHYGFYDSWDFNGWWTPTEAEAYFNVIKDYDVIAHIHGHAHNTEHYTWHGIHVFNVGSPYYDSPQWNPDGRGHFSAFRITNDTLYAGDAGWNPADPGHDIVFPSGWQVSIPLRPIVERGVITSDPPPGQIRAGSRLVLTAPEGSGFLWEHNGDLLLEQPPRVTGIDTRQIVFNPVLQQDAGNYLVGYDDGTKGYIESETYVLDMAPGPLPVAGPIALLLLACTLAGCGIKSR